MTLHRPRLVVQIAILVALVILDAISEELFLGFVSLALVILPPVSWTVAGVLVWTSRQAPDIRSLRERADDAVTLALISSAAAVAGAISLTRMFEIDLDLGHTALILIAWGFILVSVPAIDWMRTWRDVWRPMLPGRGDG